MRRIHLEHLQPGMIIARTVVGVDGLALLTKNTRLTEMYIARLNKLGLGSIYIKDDMGDVEVPEIISEQVRRSLTSTLNNSIKELSSGKTIDMRPLKKSVNLLLDNIISKHDALIQLEEIRTYDDYVFLHSINVAVFAIMTGQTLGYTENQLCELGLGSLLHDIGMISVDPAVLYKVGPLTPQENEQIRAHAQIGFNMLRTYREVSTKSMHIAYQHHERMDGLGYPRGLQGSQILDYARIVSIVDTFDALISDRPHRTGCTTTDALTVIRKLAGTCFDQEIIEAFAANVALYPMNSLVRLNTGHTAVVAAVNRHRLHSPIIRVIFDSRNKPVPNYEIDLSIAKEVSIVKRLTYEEIELLYKMSTPCDSYSVKNSMSSEKEAFVASSH
ncbi:MAG: HD-GYP domain-containing protein [Syntrophomonas sp.]